MINNKKKVKKLYYCEKCDKEIETYEIARNHMGKENDHPNWESQLHATSKEQFLKNKKR